jgi:hypothetical protein
MFILSIISLGVELIDNKAALFLMCLNDLENSTKNFLDIINTFSKVAGYQPFYIPMINRPKNVKDLYDENYKPLKKEIKDGKISHVHGLAESIL